MPSMFIRLEVDPKAAADRELFLLHHIEGVPLAELASDQECSPQAVKSRLHRARLALAEQLGKLGVNR